MIKKIISYFVLVVALSISANSFAQSLAYIDTESILEKMPAYQEAQQKLDKTVDGWKKEIERQYRNIDEMYKEFQAEQVLLTESERQRRETEIVEKEEATRKFQKEKFGTGGELFKKRQELVQPVQEQVFASVNIVVKRQKIDFVFDKSNTSGANLIYVNPEYDITEDVLKELGVK